MADELPDGTAAVGESGAVETSPSAGDDTSIEDYFKARAEASKRKRQTFFSTWKGNVERRLGRPSSSYTDPGGANIDSEVQSDINPDWALTKTKTANLWSQVPEVQITHENEQYAPAIPPFTKALNYELGEKRSNIGVAMEETLNDIVNASGVGAIIVGYAARFDTVMMPLADSLPGPNGPMPTKSVPPELLQTILQKAQSAGIQVPMQPSSRVSDDKFFCTRISPMDLLWPAEFAGSNFDDGDWIGRTGRMSWPDAKNEFRLSDDQKTAVIGETSTAYDKTLRSDYKEGSLAEARLVEYDEIYYWRHRVDPNEKSFRSIWKLVYVNGIDKPVKHEPWRGQRLISAQGRRQYVGACKFPIRVGTLTYITDNPIPPSDSSAGRPQVEDMRRSRSQMFQNRERSIPIRWYDVNRIDPLIQELLMKGTWQGMIPTNGDGNRSIGEIARASYPAEDLEFDHQTRADLMEIWRLGPNQLNTEQPGRKTGTEATIVQQNFTTSIGQERGKVASFFLGAVEVLAGLMVLYSTYPNLNDQEKQQMSQTWDTQKVLHELVLKIRPDGTIKIDTQSRIQQLMGFLNMTVKSGYINPLPVIVELTELYGLDPAKIVIKPQPKTDPPNISLRLSGKNDLINPLVMAILVREDKAPSLDDIKAAQQILDAASGLTPPQPPQAPQMPGTPGPGQPPLPPGPQGNVPPGPQGAQVPHPSQIDAHPHWTLASKVAARSEDMGRT